MKDCRLHVLLVAVGLQVACAQPETSDDSSNPVETLRYVRDKSFPADQSFRFENVSWVRFDAIRRSVAVLQRSPSPVSFWSTAGDLLSRWNTNLLGDPHSITIFDNSAQIPNAWITDMAPPRVAGLAYGHCVKRFDLSGNYLGSIGACGENTQGTGLTPVQFDKVTDIAFDSYGNKFIADGDVNGLNNRVLKLDASSIVLQDWSAPDNRSGSGPREFNLPHSVTIDDCNRAWVVDSLNSRVQVISDQGQYLGQLACFGNNQTHDVALVRQSSSITRAWISSGLPSDINGATVSIFDFQSSCALRSLPLSCNSMVGIFNPRPTKQPASAWMLHSIAVDPITQDVYIAELGGALPLTKWVLTLQHSK